MWQNTKIRGFRSILMSALIVASITMPFRTVAQPAPPVKQWTVVIDAGHGGKDPGTLGSKSKEKNVALSVALKTGKYISENLKDVRVIYTRDNDTFIGLDERSAIANRNKADIFISIHANGMDDKRPFGAETWVLGQSMDDANLKLAMKENSVITFEEDYQTKYEGYDPNSVESFIIFSLMQNTYLKQSTEFASIIQSQFRDRIGRKDRGVKQAGFVVLWRSTMPSVLVELGFLSNAEEEKYLISETGQDFLASAIFRAFRDYKSTIDNRSGIKNVNGEVKDSAGKKPAAVKAAETPAVKPAETASVKPAITAAEKLVENKPAAIPADKTVADKPSAEKSPAGSEKPPTVSEKISAVSEKTTTVPAGEAIYFTVQISAVPKSKAPKQIRFKGIETFDRIESGERYKYVAGKFSIIDQALAYRRTIAKDHPDAFVIAVQNGKIIPLREAVEAKKTTTDK
jgi:N-acetylmuramoyl-L-alanine amidase